MLFLDSAVDIPEDHDGSDLTAAEKRCGARWTTAVRSILDEFLSVKLNHTYQEDAALKAGVEQIGPKNWKKISIEWLGGQRTDVQCVHRWNKVLRPGLVKGLWTPEVRNPLE
jgi:hypothetical protein